MHQLGPIHDFECQRHHGPDFHLQRGVRHGVLVARFEHQPHDARFLETERIRRRVRLQRHALLRLAALHDKLQRIRLTDLPGHIDRLAHHHRWTGYRERSDDGRDRGRFFVFAAQQQQGRPDSQQHQQRQQRDRQHRRPGRQRALIDDRAGHRRQEARLVVGAGDDGEFDLAFLAEQRAPAWPDAAGQRLALARPQHQPRLRQVEAQAVILVRSLDRQGQRGIALVVQVELEGAGQIGARRAQCHAEPAERQDAQRRRRVNRLRRLRFGAHADHERMLTGLAFAAAQGLEAEHGLSLLARLELHLHPVHAHPALRQPVDLDEVTIGLVAQVLDLQRRLDVRTGRHVHIRPVQFQPVGRLREHHALRRFLRERIGL